MDIETYGRGMLKRVIGVIFLAGVILSSSCHKALPLPEPGPQYDPRNISRNDTYSVGPSIAVGPDGTVYVVWMDGGHNEYDPSRLYFRYKPSGGEWSEVEILTDTTRDAWAPQIAVDPSNNLHLVWESDDPTPGVWRSNIHYRMRSPSGEWSDVEVLSNTGTALQPRIAIDPSGNVHVVWNDGLKMKYAKRRPNGVWEGPEIGPIYIENPDIAVDVEGGLHLITEEGGGNDIDYLYLSPSGEWSEPVNVSQSRYISWYGSVAIGEDQTVYVLWTDEDWGAGLQTSIIYYSIKTENGWTEPDSIPGTRGMPRAKRFFDYAGKHVLVWADGRYGEDIHYLVGNGRIWGNPQVIDTPGGSIAVDAVKDKEGNIHMVWSELLNLGTSDENWEVFYEEINPLN